MFDSQEELLRKIRLGEDTSLELKMVRFKGNRVIDPKRDDLANELAAIANTHDGVLILGVDDKTRDITGIPVEHLEVVERYVYEICNESIKPPVVFRSFRVELPDLTGILRAVLKVESARSLFVHRGPGGYLYRQGSSKREMQPEFLARLFQQRSQVRLIRFDEQTVPNADFTDLDSQLWRRFRTAISPTDAQDFLIKMKLLSEDDANVLRPTVSVVLMGTNAPEEFLSTAFIQAVSYRGIERNAAYQLDAHDITGPLDIQIKEACKFVERNMRVYAIKAPNRIETPQFSLNAVFEAIVNAVVHRDYSIYGSKIRLHLFSDRLEIFSPGNISNTLTVDSLSERQSARNELLSSLLARCPLNFDVPGSKRTFIMDKRGEGVPIIITESERLSGRKPEYVLLDDIELKLTIFAAKSPHKD